jgi:hypothetical protein
MATFKSHAGKGASVNKSQRRTPTRVPKPVTFERVRELALALPGAEQGTSYGTPAFRVRGKLFARMHQDGESVVIRIDYDERRMRMETDPRTFFITDHYLRYPMMLVRLATVYDDDLEDLLEQSWRLVAPQRLIRDRDRGS